MLTTEELADAIEKMTEPLDQYVKGGTLAAFTTVACLKDGDKRFAVNVGNGDTFEAMTLLACCLGEYLQSIEAEEARMAAFQHALRLLTNYIGGELHSGTMSMNPSEDHA